ncbi:MAG: prepilin peptidase [Patescibacteria group bacterium]|nr:prepilin peptidase [Patescibacteria group bacterium]
MIYIFIFLFGLIIGSFLNVVIYRYNSGKTLNGRSMCMSCGKKLSWKELIPVFSFLYQKGKCSNCSARISWQYLIVEIVTGIVFVLTFNHFAYLLNISLGYFIFFMVLFLLMFSILIIIAVYDLRHKIIPDDLVYLFAVLALASNFIGLNGLQIASNDSMLAGILLALPFALLWLVSHGKWMGFGDAKLALGIGWLLGSFLGLTAIVLSFWIGAIVSVLMILFLRKKVKKHMEIPFAPFLIIGMLLVFFFNIDLFTLSSLFVF